MHSHPRYIHTAVGGDVIIQGGEGIQNFRSDGKTVGGDIILNAGQSHGHEFLDDGGSVKIAAGASESGEGGSVYIASGKSYDKRSGSISLLTPNAGRSGASGDIELKTGDATASKYDANMHDGHSGSFSIETGRARGIGQGGEVSIKAGTSLFADGGALQLTAGSSSFHGGSVNLYSGSGINSGNINIITPSEGSGVVTSTGEINISTGTNANGGSGELNLSSGDG